MRFQAEHHFDGPEEAVAEVLADPSFYLVLDLPDLGPAELLGSSDDGDRAVIRLRYEFVGTLDPVARRLIGSDRLAWVQEVRIARSTSSGSLSFEAEADPRRLHGEAEYTLERSEAATVRRLRGDLVVAVPGLGRMAERRIVPGLLRRLDLEAEAVEARLS